MAQPSPALLDTLDIVFLGTIGLGTIAWFARRQIAEKIFGSKDQDASAKLNGNGQASAPPKRERNFVKVMQEQGRKVIFFYGSQTGTAEDYASRLAKECQQKYGVSCMTADIELYDLTYLDTVPEDYLVFFIMATYGEGEPTDNAVDFWELVTEDEPQFSEGDALVEELAEYESENIYLGEIGEKLKEGAKIVYDAKRPYNAPITSRDLFHNTDRHCLHIEVDVSDSNLSYQTGDHIAIWPTNSDDEVTRLASILGLADKLDMPVMVKAIDSTASKQYPFPAPATYRSIFRHYLDICAPASRQTLMSLVEYAPNEETKETLRTLSKDKDEYRLKVGEAVRNLGEVLEFAAGSESRPGFFSTVPFDLIVESISRLQPRYYSISSSAKESPKSIAVTAVTLTYNPDPTPERTVYGVATNYLWQMHAATHNVDDGQKYPVYDLAGPRNALQGVKVPVHIRRSQFKLPRNPTVPVIMVGPGTGVAPFRGFVRERAAQKAEGKPVGPTLLFFGCRNSQQDFLYSEEWPGLFETLGEESRMITAFSRETPQKVYVQHRLQENGQELWNLLQKGAYIYVCGDAKNMARDVNQTFVNFAIEFGGQSEEKAHDYVKNLRNSGRYQEDVWS
ncbi:hypothetical protein BDB00DRAFT_792175 [Zychaea mexicana]|uniref:uncharacterized protein n=1 Tax=Zychaea mexicana TaxID=64656 RepID=UPI0022FE74C4|nr:uncharacterized protein BDB00DRAFT_792175 [Zychaea mexicana]KAI9488073.1 hypothetical protein BDB00DRAFT_792175 [Zychaea mexicana]